MGLKIKHSDELLGGTYRPVTYANIKVAADAEIKRGDLMAGDNPTAEFHLATSSDTAVTLCIARDNFTASSDCAVTTAYTGGVFNREKIRLDAGADINNFEAELRRQNIELTALLPVFSRG